MSSTRMVSLGFLICLAVLPAMLLTIVRDHPDAATGAGSITLANDSGKPAPAWVGAAKTPTAAGAGAQKPVEAKTAGKGTVLVEVYLPDAEAAAVARELETAQPGSVVLSFGPSQSKTAAGTGIDPYVGVEAAKRRRAYGRAVADGREAIGPVVIASPTMVWGPEKPTSEWMRQQAALAAAVAPVAELNLKTSRPAGKNAGAPWKIEFSARALGSKASLPEDAVVNLVLVEPMSAETGAPLRVVLFKPFKLPKGGSGTVELAPPAGSGAARLIAVLQHGKTMRTLATSRADLR